MVKSLNRNRYRGHHPSEWNWVYDLGTPKDSANLTLLRNEMMSQQDNFVGGFLLGTVVGGALGGILGALAASKIQASGQKSESRLTGSDSGLGFGEFDEATEESMEAARLGLEHKIAQLNEAIDDVRQQLGGINGHSEQSR